MSGSCKGPRSDFNGTFLAVMTQTECSLTWIETDDRTSRQWTSTGMIENTGGGFLKGEFGFTNSSMCNITVTAEGWDMVCASATEQCQLKGQKVSP